MSSRRITALAGSLLEASTLCAIATVSPRGAAHVNTAYFAWTRDLSLFWLSDPGARHSRNVRANAGVAVAVYDSSQSWGGADRGIQLFGSAREVGSSAVHEAERTYARRFPGYRPGELPAYRFYRFRTRRMKLFDEAVLGGGVFVIASVRRDGRVTWDRTELYRPD